MPTTLPFSTTGNPDTRCCCVSARSSRTVMSGDTVTGSRSTPDSKRLTLATSAACFFGGRFLWTIPMPPSCAMAIARRDSVTVSIAAETRGMLSWILRVSRVLRLTFRGRTLEWAGTRRTSSKVRAFWTGRIATPKSRIIRRSHLPVNSRAHVHRSIDWCVKTRYGAPHPSRGKFTMLRIALFAVVFFAAVSAQAQVHKCVDAAGKIIYTQDPCPANTKSGTMSRNVLSAPAAAPAPAASPDDKASKGDAAKGDAAKKSGPKTAAEQEQDFRKRQQDQAKAAKEAEQKSAQTQAKEQNCRNARERLAQYEIGGRLS